MRKKRNSFSGYTKAKAWDKPTKKMTQTEIDWKTKQQELLQEKYQFDYDITDAFVAYVEDCAERHGYVSGAALLRRMYINPSYYMAAKKRYKYRIPSGAIRTARISYKYAFWIVKLFGEPFTIII